MRAYGQHDICLQDMSCICVSYGACGGVRAGCGRADSLCSSLCV